MNGRNKEYPVRRTFLYNFWTGIGSLLADKQIITWTIASVCKRLSNEYKKRICHFKVWERRSTDTFKLRLQWDFWSRVLRACADLGIRAVSRNDSLKHHHWRQNKDEPVKGDICGIGLNITNSETGFRALKISHFILRYVCSNGAVARISKDDDNQNITTAKENLFSSLMKKSNRLKKTENK